MAAKAKDENDRLIEGSLPMDPSADATPMADTEIRRATAALVQADLDPLSRSLPADIHAEAQLIATLLWCGTNAPSTLSVSDVQDLLEDETRFFVPVHQDIYRAMLTVHSNLLPTSVTNVNTRLLKWGRLHRLKGIEHLEHLRASAVPTSRQELRNYAQAVRDQWARRQLIEVGNEISATARRTENSSDAVIERAHTRLVNIAQMVSAASSYVSFADVAASVLKNSSGGVTDALPTGIEELDDMTGGWYPQEVTIIAARTSVGKSALATQFTFDGVKDRPKEAALYVSLEMPARQFVARILASRAGVSLRRIRRKQLTLEDVTKLEAAEESMRATRVFFVDSQIQTIMSVSSIASRLNAMLMREGCRLVLIVVDHLGLVKPSADSAKKQREQQVAETSRGLKYLAQHHRCHVFGLAQIGREAEKQVGKSKIPQLHHIRESGSIEQDAENIIIVHRERDNHGKFKPNTPAVLNVAKARNDGLGYVWTAFDGDRGRFTRWADSEQAKARAPDKTNDPLRRPSGQYIDTTPEPPDSEPLPGRFDDDDGSTTLTRGL